MPGPRGSQGGVVPWGDGPWRGRDQGSPRNQAPGRGRGGSWRGTGGGGERTDRDWRGSTSYSSSGFKDGNTSPTNANVTNEETGRKSTPTISSDNQKLDNPPQMDTTSHGRLKPPPDGGYGLVSKGDTTLLDANSQFALYSSIVTRFAKLRAAHSTIPGTLSPLHTTTHKHPHSVSSRRQQIDPESAEIAAILLSLRKLREGIRGSTRMDSFVKDVYMFNVRAAIALSHPESFVPGLIHLLSEVHENVPLTAEESSEFAGYYMLHLGCLLEDFNEAFRVRKRYGVEDPLVDSVLRALVARDYWKWAVARKKAKLHVARLMDMAAHRMREWTAKCWSAAYFTVEKGHVERVMGISWIEAKGVHGLDWELNDDGTKVVIRKRKQS
ncbi:hypothetical protein BDZ91DRAFT_732841 [Kalaharituber pfeilii]|nr:hypothetical protein BDZ91DRAFT_732841 [Kalaharituber pfeilii]